MLMLDYKDYGWWYWLASTFCLWLAVTTYPAAYDFALLIAVVQLAHFNVAEGGLTKFPVQIRLGYLSFLLLAMPEGLQWLQWVPAIGTLARVLTGYCLMARMLMLLPFNRETTLSWRFVTEAFLTPPIRGSILHGLPMLRTSS
jgi:hypothetical protein